jgi:ring-opening amidohydrolase-like protein
MSIEVAKIELKNVQDASGLEACIARGQFAADEVIAVIGKTEGNGGVNDFTRILADQAFRRTLQKYGKRSEAEIAAIPMVWSGGCDGGRNGDERRALARGYRPPGDGGEGGGCGESRDA